MLRDCLLQQVPLFVDGVHQGNQLMESVNDGSFPLVVGTIVKMSRMAFAAFESIRFRLSTVH